MGKALAALGGLVSATDALALIRQASPASVSEVVALADALGRVLAAPVRSPVALPSFDNAALDGYALPAGAFAAGSEFDVHGCQAAGDTQIAIAVHGKAREITTGACLPPGLATVLPVEQAHVLARAADGMALRIRSRAAVVHGQHVRRIGEDVMRGQDVLAAGAHVQASELMLLSALGVAGVTVACRPRVAVISTGRELVDAPTQALQPGQIRNANRPFLCARLQSAGAELVHADTVADEPQAWHSALQQAMSAQAAVVVSTGAVSMGRHDFVPAALRQYGALVLFHKVAIRPGKPLLLAQLPNGSLYFGLPGNPVACAVGLRFFVEPALRAMLGLAEETPQWMPLAAPLASRRPGLRHHLKARVTLDRNGRCSVTALAGQESFRLLPMVQANAWLVPPDNGDACEVGDLVQMFGLGHETPLLGGE